MTRADDIAIAQASADEVAREIPALGTLLHACVLDGASVGFVLPFALDVAEAFWRDKVLPAARGGKLVVLFARSGGRILGTVQLDHDTPPNQPHRAEVRKLLVHPDFRRRGIARALMAEIEARAAALGRSLLTLDTRTGDAAEPLYASLGYQRAGIIPAWCRNTIDGSLEATTVMYKAL